MKIRIFTTIFLLSNGVENAVQAAPRLAKDVTAPLEDGVADPDRILTDTHRQVLVDHLQNVADTVRLTVNDEEGNPSKNVEVQVAIAIVERMNLKDGYPNMEEDEAAERFARTLHDTWGVGHNTAAGGTGVLIFLSVYDRIVYISRGGALDRILNNDRIDKIISNMRPAMRQAKYTEGLVSVVNEVVEYIEKGEPSWKETLTALFQIQNIFILGWLGALFHAFRKAGQHRQEKVEYAEAASQLSEIDRAQARALQGQYQATSCPICLENFQSATVGSDGQPMKLLRCGHVFDESCWSEWVSSGRGNITKCPICKMDIGQSHATATTSPVAEATTRDALTDTPAEADGFQLVEPNDTAQDNNVQDTLDQERVVRRFQQERNFRLMRLGTRYPSFFTQSQIQRWSSPTYNGSLVRDTNFRQRDPQLIRQEQLRKAGGGNRMGSSRPVSFGGGRSSGGRSGRF